MKLWREISFTAAKAAEIPRALTEDFINLAELCKKKKKLKRITVLVFHMSCHRYQNYPLFQVLQQDTGSLEAR